MIHTLAVWGFRAYTLVKILKLIGQTRSRTPRQNARALVSGANDTRKALMALTNSPGASIRPASQDARNRSRAQVPMIRTVTTALLGSAGTEAIRVGEHLITENDAGVLVAITPEGDEIPLTGMVPTNEKQPTQEPSGDDPASSGSKSDGPRGVPQPPVPKKSKGTAPDSDRDDATGMLPAVDNASDKTDKPATGSNGGGAASFARNSIQAAGSLLPGRNNSNGNATSNGSTDSSGDDSKTKQDGDTTPGSSQS